MSEAKNQGAPIRRLTIEEVRAAVDKTGLKLMRNITLRGDCGCPIGVVGQANDCIVLISPEVTDTDFVRVDPYVIADKLGLAYPYTVGLIYGFDGKPETDVESEYDDLPVELEQCKLGYTDGQAIAAALLPEI